MNTPHEWIGFAAHRYDAMLTDGQIVTIIAARLATYTIKVLHFNRHYYVSADDIMCVRTPSLSAQPASPSASERPGPWQIVSPWEPLERHHPVLAPTKQGKSWLQIGPRLGPPLGAIQASPST